MSRLHSKKVEAKVRRNYVNTLIHLAPYLLVRRMFLERTFEIFQGARLGESRPWAGPQGHGKLR